MRKTLITMVALAGLMVFSVACKKKEGEGGEGDKASAEGKKDDAPAPEPFTGELTVDRLKKAKSGIKPFDPWDKAYAALLGEVGKEGLVDGKDYQWGVVQGDKCAHLKVEKNGNEVGATSFGEVDKMMKSMFDECAKAAGVEPAAGGDDSADKPDEGDEGKEEGKEDAKE